MEQLEDPITPAVQVIGRCEARQLMTLYKVALSAACCLLVYCISYYSCKLEAGCCLSTGLHRPATTGSSLPFTTYLHTVNMTLHGLS